MCMIKYLDQLRDAGIDSIKVEGRMAVVEGVNALSGCRVRAGDLRCDAGCAQNLPSGRLSPLYFLGTNGRGNILLPYR